VHRLLACQKNGSEKSIKTDKTNKQPKENFWEQVANNWKMYECTTFFLIGKTGQANQSQLLMKWLFGRPQIQAPSWV
jgi:hypothetical protein